MIVVMTALIGLKYPGEIPDAFIEFRGPIDLSPLCIYDINGTVEQYEKKHIRSAIFNEPSKMWSISRPPKGASSVHSPDQFVIPSGPYAGTFMRCYPTRLIKLHFVHSVSKFCISCI